MKQFFFNLPFALGLGLVTRIPENVRGWKIEDEKMEDGVLDSQSRATSTGIEKMEDGRIGPRRKDQQNLPGFSIISIGSPSALQSALG